MICALKTIGNTCSVVILLIAATLGFTGCGDVSKAPAPASAPPGPGPLTILTTSPLPDGTINHSYSIALAASGGTPGYTWSLAPGSPQLPAGLTLSAAGIISGMPTTVVGSVNLVIQVQDSGSAAQGSQQTVTKALSITINVAPAPLQITSTSPLTAGTITVPYLAALIGNGGTTPYQWAVKAGSSLPPGLTLDTTNGFIQGTPTQTSSVTPSFTLTDAAGTTVEKALNITISAVSLSITTASPLPQGTANQNYSATLVATGGTGTHTWGLANGSPSLAAIGLTLNPSTGVISGIPTGTSNQNYTFTATDQTLPTPQVATKVLQLVIGAAPPTLTITTPAGSSLPSGSVGSAYNTSLVASGGTGAHTWSIIGGTTLPNGLVLASSTGAISGTPQVGSNGTTSLTVQVQDSGTPQQTMQKALSITINLPAAPVITTTSLPAGTFNVAYNQTVSVTGGIGTLVWGVISGALPPGLSLNTTNGNISGPPTSTGSFQFTLRVTDSIPQFDDQILTITINPPAPPSITSPNLSSLPTGTVNQPYPNTQLFATGGATPYTWSVNPTLPNGLSLDLNSGAISGTPLSGSNNDYNPTFTVTDSTVPTHQTATRSYTLKINANVTSVTITTTSPLLAGTVGQAYTAPPLAASGGTLPYNWSNTTAMPPGLSVGADGTITGTPTTSGTTSTTFKVLDSTVPNQQSATKPLSITINAAPLSLAITTNSLPDGKKNQAYASTLAASGGTIPYTWSVTPGLPTGLTLAPATGVISGTPTAMSNINYNFTVQDSTNQTTTKQLKLQIKN
jgi:hypothetical protein